MGEDMSGIHWTAGSPFKMHNSMKKIEAPSPPTSKDTDDVYLELEYSSIHNRVAENIRTTGPNGWFEGEVIDVAFELLEKNPLTDGSIGFIGTPQAESCCKAANPREKFEPKYYSMERMRFEGKSFIFFPISDAYDNWKYNKGTDGTHWSLLLVDLRDKQIQARYYDSSMPREPGTKPSNFGIAQKVLEGFQRIYYNDDKQRIPIEITLAQVDRNSPSQVDNNICEADMGAACGPFVYEMARGISHYIIFHGLAKESTPLPWIKDSAREGIFLDSKAIRGNVLTLIYQQKERQKLYKAVQLSKTSKAEN